MTKDFPLKKTVNPRNFDGVFTKINHNSSLNSNDPNCLEIYSLEIQNNKFSYEALLDFLERNIGNYVMGRLEIDKLIEQGAEGSISLKSAKRFHRIHDNDPCAGGELGEFLLYSFLESALHAPKLLSKMQLKTDRNEYVKGADAVHLLKLCDDKYQLIIGESKIYKDKSRAVREAFVSIKTSLNDLDAEYSLIDTHLIHEIPYGSEYADFIRSIVIPGERNKKYKLDNAISIFIGYTSTSPSSDLPNDEFRKQAKLQIAEDANHFAELIMNKIEKYHLSSYSFYVYLLPFTDATEDRKEIMRKLLNEE